MRQKLISRLFFLAVVLLCLAIIWNLSFLWNQKASATLADGPIQWVDFNVTATAMEKALALDIQSQDEKQPVNWIELLAYLGTQYGGNFKKYKAKDMDALYAQLQDGKTMDSLTKDRKNYDYYLEAYTAVLGGMVGEYQIQSEDSYLAGHVELQTKYGLRAYSPIAYGYSFSHYDDFGVARSFGFRRSHLGNDLLGSIGTPIICVESGVVETIGWNRYGGWRVGIRSLDGKRYYYYAHLRKDRPYHVELKEGSIIEAGDIIGYLGMTGYSDQENVNGMNVPHLHFGMQLIFDESQKEGNDVI